MYAYIVRRLLLIVPTIILVTFVVFFLIRLIPGNVVDLLAARNIGAEDVDVEKLRNMLGLDVPIHLQYVRWVGNLLQGDLGSSLWTRRPLVEEIKARLPVSIELGILAIVIGQLVAIPVGVLSAVRQDTGADYIGRSAAILFMCVPSFWLATLVMVFPSIWWQWTPPLEFVALTQDPLGNLKGIIIPALIMGLAASGTSMRMVRTMMLETLKQDYIRTAWAKGLKERTVVARHAMKNALMPVITMIGMNIPVLISGTVIIEQIFNLPGMGRLLVDALTKRDYPIISGANLFVAGFVLLCNLSVDITYGYLDPRIHYR
ncbi:MAG: ABC transporter permease [Dehalococcoidia bacterium]|nr:ABC transporter permease [Dehalococcoidia bacterium]